VTNEPQEDPLGAWAKRHGLKPLRSQAEDERQAARTLLADSLARLGEHRLARATRSGANAKEPLVAAALTAIMTATRRRDGSGNNER
jgi:hypothetical protein